MPLLRGFGRTRAGEGRAQNEDAFVARPDRGLFAVVDATGDAHAATVTMAALEECVAHALRSGELEGAREAAAARARGAIVELLGGD